MSLLLKRFENRAQLVRALMAQHILAGHQSSAEALAEAGELIAYLPGAELMHQGGMDDDAYFLLAGKVDLIVHGERFPYGRGAGDVVGEFTAINSAIARTATIVAAEEVVALKCSAAALDKAASTEPEIWRLIAVSLTRKIEQRNDLVNSVNERPVIFMIAIDDRKTVAEEIKLALERDYQVFLWSEDHLFPPGSYQLENLHRTAAIADFGIIMADPDDLRRSPERAAPARDSLQFELGYVMSQLWRHRTILLLPQEDCDAVPVEFKGLRPLCYASGPTSTPLNIRLQPTIEQIRELVATRRIRSRMERRD